MSISTWNYESQDEETRHTGPMAEEFAAAFGLGESDRRISAVDADGVALAAIQGLAERVADASDELSDRLAANEERIDRLEAENERID